MNALIERIAGGHRPDDDEALSLAAETDLATLMATAGALRDATHGDIVTYSRKVFIPLTQLCRDVCHYCTFAHPPRRGEAAYLTPEQAVEIARQGASAGCTEALFTLGDKPELRYRAARRELEALGFETTIDYLVAVAERVRTETGLLPHANPGVLTDADIADLRRVTVSQGLMLESTSERLCAKGGAHYGSPDKKPAPRLDTLERTGAAQVPMTTGILIGIGETRPERIEALLAMRDSHDRHGHIQEVIVQAFRAKAGTRMETAPEPDDDDLLWTVAVARLILGGKMNIQAPPNLSPNTLSGLVAAGINDWGGVSPVTPDHVNPEAPWPHLDALSRDTAANGKVLIPRLPLYPAYALDDKTWLDKGLRTAVLRSMDSEGFARTDTWSPGTLTAPAATDCGRGGGTATVDGLIERARDGDDLNEDEVVRLFAARGDAFDAVCAAADDLRAEVSGDTVTYVVNRNINYTNVCTFGCRFCAFSKGRHSAGLRGPAYDLERGEIARRTAEAWQRGATEVCMQGGIHPDYTGDTYIDICHAVKEAAPDMHVHAFSPLEVWQGAETLGQPLSDFLARLRDAGLGSLPGTAAEILDDEVRAILCPDKVNTAQWLEVMEAAHGVGLTSTTTIMFGHVDAPLNWARHLLRLRTLQKKTGGFTEFVPLPFVHMEAPIYLQGKARMGPTYREAVLMHAVPRLVLHPHITNIQTSWVKMGPEGAAACLAAGANDLGGTLMNETITRAAGAAHGQEMPPEAMEALIKGVGRTPHQRTTSYVEAADERARASYGAATLTEVVNRPAGARRPGKNGEAAAAE